MKSYEEIKCEKIFDIIKRIKSNLPISEKEIKKLDNFFSDKENQIFLNMILSENITFDLSVLEKTIHSTFKNNFNLFRSMCKKGINPTIYVGYSSNKNTPKENKSILIGNSFKPFIWIEKEEFKNILKFLHNTKFNLNLYYYIDGVININDLNKLKLHSNLTLVGKNNNSFINLNNFSNQRLDVDELQEVLI